MKAKAIAIAVTGASGAVYATRTVAALLERGVHVELIVSDYGRRLLRDELGEQASIDRLMPFLTGKYGAGVGAGTMTITESKPNERVATRTDFVKPFEGTSNADFIFSQQGNQTNVIWTMTGHQNFIAKAICLVMNMEATLGPDFEKGLAQLKAVAEKK